MTAAAAEGDVKQRDARRVAVAPGQRAIASRWLMAGFGSSLNWQLSMPVRWPVLIRLVRATAGCIGGQDRDDERVVASEHAVIDQPLGFGTSERDLRSILENIPDAVSVKGRDHRYRLVNHAFEQRFGLQTGEIEGRRDDVVLPASMLAADRESDEIVLRTREPTQREEILVRDGEDRVYRTVKFAMRDDSGEIVGVCAVFTDVTERRRRENERREVQRWTDRIHGAVSHDLLVLHGQPIVNLVDGRIERAELLVRMRDHPGSSALLGPKEFLPAAERFGLIAIVDLWVLARALELAEHHRVAINLSGKTIGDPDHVAEIERLVRAGRAAPENIIFEITETAVVENLEAARAFAQRLRVAGCSFALDDFGVGFGSFSYLKHLPVDYLKIDIEFVRDLVFDETDRHVVHAMVAVARGFGIKTIAEGVENQATLELLADMGVDYAQGFWVGRPAPFDELWPYIPD